MRYVWIVLLALSLSTVVYGQKSAAVRQLEQQRKEALADIEETNKLLQETAQTAKTSLNRLNLLSKQILSRKKVISLLNQELDEIEKDILNIQGQLRTLKRELGDKQTNYGKSMRGLYKRHSSQDKLLFILSAESFSQSMRRMRYLREYADWQKRQANDIVEKQAEISRKQAEMEKTRAEKRALLGTRQEESKKLESEEASQKEEVQLLNKRQKDLKADLQKKRRQAEALNRQIEKLIAEEIARAEAEAKKKAEQERLAREKEEAAREAQRRAVPASDSGSRFRSLLDQIAAQETVLKEKKDAEEKAKANAPVTKVSLEDLFSQIQAGEMKNLNLIVKADVQGSVEAVKSSLEKLSNEEVRVRVIHGGVGAINESDVMLASTSQAIIVGFNVRPDAAARDSAARANVDMRMYRVIYDAINEIEAAMKGMLAPKFREVLLGHAEVRQTYKVSGVGTVAGCYVQDGKLQRKDCQVRLVRDGIVIHEGVLASLQRFKDSVKEVQAGYECGLSIEKFNDIKEGDIVEAFTMEQIEV